MVNNSNSQALNMFLDILTRADEVSFSVEQCFIHLHNSDPAGCCRALRILLDKRFDNFIKAISENEIDSEENPILQGFRFKRKFDEILDEYFVSEVIAGSALAAPSAFVLHLLPWFIRVTTYNEKQGTSTDRYASDSFFSYQLYSYYSLKPTYAPDKTSFIEALIEAMRRVAEADPSGFRAIAHEMSEFNSESIHAVLARTYINISNPEEYAEDIFEYLIADERRLDIGNNRCDSTQLFSIAFKYGDAQKREHLERIVLELRPELELRYRDLGYTQALFLKSVVTPALLSKKAYSRLQELERRFPDVKPGPDRQDVEFRAVPSPISPVELDKMKDRDLLKAMTVYDESTGWNVPPNERRNFLEGGLVELSRLIAEKAKEYPNRFYNLTRKIDEAMPVEYIEAILSGLAGSDTPKEQVFEVAQRFSFRFTGYSRAGFCRSLQRCANENVPDDLLDVVTQWALTDPDPDPSFVDTSGRPNEWLNRGINSVRGVAIQTAAQCSIDSTPPRTQRAVKLLSQAVPDPSPAVGACVLQSLLPLLNDQNEGDRALQLCDQVLEQHPQLLEDP